MDKRQRENLEMWALSVDVWKEAACVTKWMEATIGGLRDADGEPLPDVAKQFMLDLLYLRAKTKSKTRNYLPKKVILEQYRMRLFWEQRARELPRNDGKPIGTPSETVIQQLADMFNTSTAVISQIVHPRPSRLPRKSRKT